ncbi:MAG: hypothetical protein ACRDNB_01475 [Gaiellaceae bacterium]
MSTQTPVPELDEPRRERRPPSPLDAVATLSRPVVAFVWTEKRGLALTALLYLLGLVVWSLNAARRDLGLGAAADLQYLVAGIVPAIVLAVALALLVAWLRVPAWSRDRLATRAPRLSARLGSVGTVLFGASVVAIAGLGWTGVFDRFAVLTVVVFTAFATGIVLLGLTKEESWLFRLLWYVYGPIGVLLLLALAFAFYAEGIYPRLPQSLGGGKPRCAELDLDASSLSSATLAELAPGAPPQGIVRTQRLDVVFTQGDTLFVQRPAQSRVLELRGGAIRAVVGCG